MKEYSKYYIKCGLVGTLVDNVICMSESEFEKYRIYLNDWETDFNERVRRDVSKYIESKTGLGYDYVGVSFDSDEPGMLIDIFGEFYIDIHNKDNGEYGYRFKCNGSVMNIFSSDEKERDILKVYNVLLSDAGISDKISEWLRKYQPEYQILDFYQTMYSKIKTVRNIYGSDSKFYKDVFGNEGKV